MKATSLRTEHRYANGWLNVISLKFRESDIYKNDGIWYKIFMWIPQEENEVVKLTILVLYAKSKSSNKQYP